MAKTLYGISLFLLLIACEAQVKAPVKPAFYFWQTTFSLSNVQKEYLHKTGCKKLYIKLADIGLDQESGEIIPYAQLEVADSSGLAAYELAHVIFITNEVFLHLEPEKCDWLAEKVAQLHARTTLPQQNLAQRELQVDCDWTARTRAMYFRFLASLRTKIPHSACLSATIRLHQYKFPAQTGVPPVERGMLMCYNTGDIDDAAANNSIFDPQDARKYLHGAPEKYPLPLDLALPAFSWLLVYRNDALWKIIPGAHEEIAIGVLQKGTFLSGHYLRPGDLIRRELVSADVLQNAARLAASADVANNATLAFFHLNDDTPGTYPVQLIDAVCHLTDSIRSAN